MSLAARIRQHCLDAARQGPADQDYVPLLLDYTHEDRAAKGLRAFEPGQQKVAPVYFGAAELIEQAPLLLLHGPAGSGKSTLARYWLQRQAKAWLADHDLAVPLLTEAGAEHPLLEPLLATGRAVLLIVDNAEQWHVEPLLRLANTHQGLRLLVLGRSEPCAQWALGPHWQRHGLLPLQAEQRQAFIRQHRPALVDGFAAHGDPHLLGRPAAFVMALSVGAVRSELELVERWQPGADPTTALFNSRYAQGRLAVSRLRHAPATELTALLHSDPLEWSEPLLQLGVARAQDGEDVGQLINAFSTAGPQGVLLACELAQLQRNPQRAPLLAALLTIIEAGREPLNLRVRAAQWLARWGDPRDLQALVDVPAGTLTLGSERHPTSAPVAAVALAAYRIGRYPVCNRDYAQFITATGRGWRSEQGWLPERANAPAVDLTWHDARAYCDWLTTQWQVQGRIAAHERVSLPTEPQWEYAARGPQGNEVDRDVYPWPGGWREGHGNGEEAALNDTCAVGLFPLGRSVWGCDDLCGQVWEWTTTLWGEDMAQPRFAYPYADDGREACEAPPQVRRVLRGGCFSSPGFKACCTYRGSLEPDGFWRGNGFRVVVVDVRGVGGNL
ncbi:SUMF1/EgtB/PvdO family nonheme iron enzyme [Pseudomonas putida]